MRILWLDDGLHVSAESEEEWQFLAHCWDKLQKFEVGIGEEVSSIAVNEVQTDKKQSIV